MPPELMRSEETFANGDKIVMTLTTAQTVNKLSKADFDKIQWTVACLNGKSGQSRTFTELRTCPCLYCQTACVTLFKWRMIR